MKQSSNFDVNYLEGAQMAVGIESIFYGLLNNKHIPFDFYESLDKAISFLQEAEDGANIMCGRHLDKNFIGTLLPLQLSLNHLSYKSLNDKNMFEETIETLKSYKNLLCKIRDRKMLLMEENTTANGIYNFFTNLRHEFSKNL